MFAFISNPVAFLKEGQNKNIEDLRDESKDGFITKYLLKPTDYVVGKSVDYLGASVHQGFSNEGDKGFIKNPFQLLNMAIRAAAGDENVDKSLAFLGENRGGPVQDFIDNTLILRHIIGTSIADALGIAAPVAFKGVKKAITKTDADPTFDLSDSRTGRQATDAEDPIGPLSKRDRTHFGDGFVGTLDYLFTTKIADPIRNLGRWIRRLSTSILKFFAPNAVFRTGFFDEASRKQVGQSLANKAYEFVRGQPVYRARESGIGADGLPRYSYGDVRNLTLQDLQELNFTQAGVPIPGITRDISSDSLARFRQTTQKADPQNIGFVNNLITERARQYIAQGDATGITPDFTGELLKIVAETTGPFQKNRMHKLARDLKETVLRDPNATSNQKKLFQDYVGPSGQIINRDSFDTEFNIVNEEVVKETAKIIGDTILEFGGDLIKGSAPQQALIGAVKKLSIDLTKEVGGRVLNRAREYEIAVQRGKTDSDRKEGGFRFLDPLAGFDDIELLGFENALGLPFGTIPRKGFGTPTKAQDQAFLRATEGINLGDQFDQNLNRLRQEIKRSSNLQELANNLQRNVGPTPNPPDNINLPDFLTNNTQFIATIQSILDEGIDPSTVNKALKDISHFYAIQENKLLRESGLRDVAPEGRNVLQKMINELG